MENFNTGNHLTNDKYNTSFLKDLIDGIKYNLWIPNTIKDFNELPKSAIFMLGVFLLGLIAYFFILGDYSFWGILSIIGLIVSAINLILVDNGKLSSFIWAIFSAICSLIGAVYYQMYGEVIYYLFVFPCLIYGIGEWKKLARENANDNDNTTQAKCLNSVNTLLFSGLGAGSFLFSYFVSSQMGGVLLIIDSAVLATGVVAEVMLAKSFRAQWLLWIAHNIIAISAWVMRLNIAINISDPISYPISMIIMWSLFLINAFYGCYQWYQNDKLKEISR